MKRIAPSRLRSYQKSEALQAETPPNALCTTVKPEWLLVDRIVSIDNDSGEPSETKYFIKWQDLPYEECTWETPSSLKSVDISKALNKYQQFNNYAVACESTEKQKKLAIKGKRKESDFIHLESQPTCLSGGQLHDYQMEGLNWLRYSWQLENNVILADEMGLGKTVQTVAFIASLAEEYSIRGPFLLVVPLSTIKQWEREIALWAPHLNAVLFR